MNFKDKKTGERKYDFLSLLSHKKSQSKKSKIFSLSSQKRAQEEIIGFALIIILVAVILLVFLGISLNKDSDESVQSYEVENYIQSFLQYTTDCSDSRGFHSIKDLVFECQIKQICIDKRETCDVLNSTLKDISEASWDVGEETPLKGYELEIISTDGELVYFKEGNGTFNSKGSSQEFSKSGVSIGVYFTAYY